jgi:hypothetical protein
METVIVTIDHNYAEITFQSPDVNVLIVNKDRIDYYLYQDNLVCRIRDVNDDGTVNVESVDTLDGKRNNRIIRSVSIEDLGFYSSEDDLDEDEEDWL